MVTLDEPGLIPGTARDREPIGLDVEGGVRNGRAAASEVVIP